MRYSKRGPGQGAGGWGRGAVAAGAGALLLVLLPTGGWAQALRFANHREVAIPDYATLRIGPFYSTAAFSQSAGYRYSRSGGTGTDYLTQNERGLIHEDGSEFPLISTLTFRNYLLITRNCDLDLSVGLRYEEYPMNTQDGGFFVDMVEEGAYGTLSSSFRITPTLRGTIYDNIQFKTDYVDTQGIVDPFGGEEYTYMNNVLGVRTDWLFSRDKNLSLDLYREDNIPYEDGFDEREFTAYGEALSYEQMLFPLIVVGARAGFTQTDFKLPSRPDTRQEDYSVYTRYNMDEAGAKGARLRVTQFTSAQAGLGYSAGYGGTRDVGETTINGTTVQNPVGDEVSEPVGEMTGFAEVRTQMRETLWHQVGYYHSLRTGWEADFEIVDRYEYRLGWDGKATKVQAHSALSAVEPLGANIGRYNDWENGVDISYPLTRRVLLWWENLYTLRRNPDAENYPFGAPEDTSDYETFSSRLGTTVEVTRSINFETYGLHVERFSDNEDLAYTWDIFEARFVYHHQF